MRLILFILFLITILSSCKKDQVEEDIYMGYAYFPNEKGRWVEYDVDSIVWDDFYSQDDPRHVDTFSFKIREEIGAGFVDNNGDASFEIYRYKKTDTSQRWELKDVWFGKRTALRAEKVEENERFIKLVFPVKENETWSGNAYISWPKWIYGYQEIHQPIRLNGVDFDSTITVLQDDEESVINKIYAKEIYANHIGLIYKEYLNVLIDPLEKYYTKGVYYKMEYLQSGWNNIED